jgi:hypothetical protein
MTGSKAKDAPAKHLTVAQQAEQRMRKRLAENPAPVDYKLGGLKAGAKLTPLWRNARETGGALGRVVSPDPITNKQAKLQEHYMHGQEFAIFNPCVS